MKIVLSYSFIIFVFLQALFFLKPLNIEVREEENRMVYGFPTKLRLTKNGIIDYFAAIDSFFGDRVLFRAQAFEVISALEGRFNEVPDFHLAYKGKDEWLFYGENGAVEKLVGSIKPGRPSRIVDDLQGNIQDLKKIPVIFVVGPNKSSIYPEYLPDFIRPTSDRYIDFYLNQLRALGAEVIDPTAILIENKTKGLLYYRTDTHWNQFGASLAVESLINNYNLSLPPDRWIKLPEYEFVNGPPFSGDIINLGNFRKVRPREGDNYRFEWKENRADLYGSSSSGASWNMSAEEEIPNFIKGQSFLVRNPQPASDKKIWFFCDSFGRSMGPLLHASFAETRYIENKSLKNVGKMLQNEHKPDLIIVEIVERDI